MDDKLKQILEEMYFNGYRKGGKDVLDSLICALKTLPEEGTFTVSRLIRTVEDLKNYNLGSSEESHFVN